MRRIIRQPIKIRLYALIALEFLFGIVYGIFSLTLPILAESIIVHIAILGIIFALPEILGTIIDIPVGEFAKRFGRRKTILYSGILLALSSLAFMLTRNPFLFVVVLIFYEFATQSFIIPGDAEEAALTPARSTGRFNGLLEGFHNLGFSLGPVMAGFAIGYRIEYAFWISFAVSMLMALVSFIFLQREKNHEGFAKSVGHLITRDKIFKSGFKSFSGLGFEGIFVAFIFFAFALHWGFIGLMEPLYTKILGLDEWQIGLIYAGFTFPIFFVSIVVGRYIDRHEARWVTACGMSLHAFSAFGFALTLDPLFLFIFALVSGVGDALILPAVFTMFDRLSSYRTKEHISGVKMFGESFGYFVGPLFGGAVAAIAGYASAFFALGVFLAALTVAIIAVPLRVACPAVRRHD